MMKRKQMFECTVCLNLLEIFSIVLQLIPAHEKLLASSVDKNMTAIVWSSEMTHKEWVQEAYPPQQYAIQLWGESSSLSSLLYSFNLFYGLK